MLPDLLLSVDDGKVGNVMEHSELFYPDDNSIMRVDSWAVGGVQSAKSVIYKDNLTFGLRNVAASELEPLESEFGLVSLKAVSDTEFWLNFENDTRLTVQQS